MAEDDIKLDKEQIEEFKEVFNIFDKDGSGTIDASELKAVMESIGEHPTDKEVDEMMKEVDDDGSGEIDFNEFLRMMEKLMMEEPDENELRTAFKEFDPDDTGVISVKNLKEAFAKVNPDTPEEELEEMIKKADKNGDGEIDCEEFLKLMAK